jgi:hypothetical protein
MVAADVSPLILILSVEMLEPTHVGLLRLRDPPAMRAPVAAGVICLPSRLAALQSDENGNKMKAAV